MGQMHIDYRYTHDAIRQSVISMQNARHFDERQLKIAEYENAVIAPRSEQCAGGLYCDNSPVRYSNCYDVYEPKPNGEKIEYSDNEVLFLGMLYSPWGHCITDHLSRVWPFLSANIKAKNLDVVYVMASHDSDLPANYFTLLELLGVERCRIHKIEVLTQFKKVYFPDRSFWHNEYGDGNPIRHYSKEYVETVDAIREASCPAKRVRTRRVYLSRSGWKKGFVDFGEQTLEQVFARKYNCEVLRPETLTFEQTVQLMYECEVLVTTDGSIAHNAIFGPDGLNMVILRKSDFVNYHQPVINEIKNLAVTYIDVYHGGWLFNNRDEPWVGPFYLYVTRYVAEFLGGGIKFSIAEFLRYLKCFFSGKIHNVINHAIGRSA